MTRYPQLPTSPLVAMLSLLFMLIAAGSRVGAGRQPFVGVRALGGLAKTVSAATRSVEGAGMASSGVGVDGSRYVSSMPERVEAWWSRRQWSKGLNVPYPVGTYREAWAPFPALIRQYHPELNAGITLTQVPPPAEVLLLWECESGHRFAATPTEQRMRPGRERRRSAWCPECSEAANPTKVVALPMRETVTAPITPAALRPRRPRPKMQLCTKTPDVPVGTAFVSECAPKPASAVEAQMRVELTAPSCARLLSAPVANVRNVLEPPSDVNWLLSALAQASAAMIAIIGGLLVSRYVALHSEQEAARRRVADLQRRSAEASLRAEAASAELATYQIDDALLDSRVFNALANSGFDLTPSAALLAVDHDGDGLDEALLARRVAEISDDLEAAFDAIDPLVPESLNHESWTEFRQRHSLPVGNREVWEWAYDEVCDVQRERARAAEERSQPAWARGLSTNIAHDVALSSMRALVPAVGPHYEVARLSALRAAVDSADAHKRALEQERRLATETFEATRQPEGFGLALQVLSILAVLGMALPVIIMGFEVTTLPALSRAAVIFCFLGGVSLLLRFLFVYASFLREGGRAALPATAFGLLLPARKKRGKRRAADLGPPS